MNTGMHPWLASIYGTDGADDLEKTAQTHLLHKLAADQNIDLSQFSPEELQQLAAEMMEEQGLDPQQLQQGMPQGMPQQGMSQRPFAPAQQPQAPQMQQQPSGGGMQPFQMAAANQQQGGGMDAMQKEAQAKFDEADLLGRVMAHAYTQELEKIAGRFGAAKESVKGAFNSAKNRAGHVASRVGEKARSKATEYGMKARHHKGAIAAGAGGLAAGVAAGEAHGRMSKKASAFEKLAEMQAAEILGATGYDPATGTDLAAQQQETQQYQNGQNNQMQDPNMQQGQFDQNGQQMGQEQPQQEFAEALDQRALEMLQEAGYDVNEILARLQLSQQQGPGQA